jgi:hypothetical protein
LEVGREFNILQLDAWRTPPFYYTLNSMIRHLPDCTMSLLSSVKEPMLQEELKPRHVSKFTKFLDLPKGNDMQFSNLNRRS